VSVALAVLVGGFLMLVNSENPVTAYVALVQSALGSQIGIASTLAAATPLIFTGLSVAVAFRAGMFNIGSERQLYLGGLVGGLIGIYVAGVAGIVLIPLALVGGTLAGALFAYVFGFLRVQFGTNEVVTTIMANYLAQFFVDYLVNGPLKPASAAVGTTQNILPAARLPILVATTTLSIGFLLALAAVALIWLLFERTVLGYEMKMGGWNILAARYGGVPTGSVLLKAMIISGALAGLGGVVEILGSEHRVVQDFSPGYGFTGILIALMAFNDPIAILPVSILFGMLSVGAVGMELQSGVPNELSEVVQALIILFIAAQAGLGKALGRVPFRSRAASEGKFDIGDVGE
jgi:simple sugar transport system permease protein